MTDKQKYEYEQKCRKYDLLEKGWEYQDFCSMVLLQYGIILQCFQSQKWQFKLGESLNGIEVKFDDKLKTTGNIYIEIESKSDYYSNEWVQSGLFAKDRTWLYLIGDYNEIFIFSKKHLKALIYNGKYQLVTAETSKGWLIPRQDAMVNADKYIKLKGE